MCVANCCVVFSTNYLHTRHGYVFGRIHLFIGASLSEPHIDHDNGSRVRNNGMYLSIILSFIPRWSAP